MVVAATEGTRPLWRNGMFMRICLSATLSQFGGSITAVSLQLIATTVLHASPLQMSFLAAANGAAFLTAGLLAGVMADRLRPRAILIAADLARALAVLAGVGAVLTGTLGTELLYIVAFGVSLGGVCFDVANASYVPAVVGNERLLAANSHLSLSQSVADAAGPSVCGAIGQVLGVTFAAASGALAYVASAILMVLAPDRSPERCRHVGPAAILGGVLEGISFTYRHPLLRILTLRLAVWHFVVGAVQSMLMIFLVERLALLPGEIGSLLSVMGVGTLAAAVSASRVAAQLGVGRAIMVSNLIAALFALLLPLSADRGRLSMILVGAALMVFGYCVNTYQISNVSLRQAATPLAMLGRMTAATRVATLSASAAGALMAGLIGHYHDVRFAISLFVVLGVCLACMGMMSSPLAHIRTIADLVAQEHRVS